MKKLLKRVLPDGALNAARHAEAALGQRLMHQGHLAVYMRDRFGLVPADRSRLAPRRAYIDAMLGWLERAHDGGDGGVPGYYALASGWSA